MRERNVKVKTIHLIAAARPNFVKIAPLYHILSKEKWVECCIVHTGQHYDLNMSDVFFEDLELPTVHFHLNVGSGTHAEQTARTMLAYETLCLKNRPDLTIVVGDVNATMACAIAAKKLLIPVAHIEAGLRSGDREMPEEINRIVVDAISDLFYIPSLDAEKNLLLEGVNKNKIHFVGNIMIDSYELFRLKIDKKRQCDTYGLQSKDYGVITLHRPSNVDKKEILEEIVDTLVDFSKKGVSLVFPVHPRTYTKLDQFKLFSRLQREANIQFIHPLSYIQFMSLVKDAKFILTDSGGIQEETTYLGIPCLTLRSTTERPITLTEGTNELVTIKTLPTELNKILTNQWKKGRIPTYWDGKTAVRIIENLKQFFGG